MRFLLLRDGTLLATHRRATHLTAHAFARRLQQAIALRELLAQTGNQLCAGRLCPVSCAGLGCSSVRLAFSCSRTLALLACPFEHTLVRLTFGGAPVLEQMSSGHPTAADVQHSRGGAGGRHLKRGDSRSSGSRIGSGC